MPDLSNQELMRRLSDLSQADPRSNAPANVTQPSPTLESLESWLFWQHDLGCSDLTAPSAAMLDGSSPEMAMAQGQGATPGLTPKELRRRCQNRKA
jgi:hypothetical protein